MKTMTTTITAQMEWTPNPEEAMKLIKAELAKNPEPVADWMRKRGRPPEHGWVCFLPLELKELIPFPPDYVRFSVLLTDRAVILRPGEELRYRPSNLALNLLGGIRTGGA